MTTDALTHVLALLVGGATLFTWQHSPRLRARLQTARALAKKRKARLKAIAKQEQGRHAGALKTRKQARLERQLAAQSEVTA